MKKILSIFLLSLLIISSLSSFSVKSHAMDSDFKFGPWTKTGTYPETYTNQLDTVLTYNNYIYFFNRTLRQVYENTISSDGTLGTKWTLVNLHLPKNITLESAFITPDGTLYVFYPNVSHTVSASEARIKSDGSIGPMYWIDANNIGGLFHELFGGSFEIDTLSIAVTSSKGFDNVNMYILAQQRETNETALLNASLRNGLINVNSIVKVPQVVSSGQKLGVYNGNYKGAPNTTEFYIYGSYSKPNGNGIDFSYLQPNGQLSTWQPLSTGLASPIGNSAMKNTILYLGGETDSASYRNILGTKVNVKDNDIEFYVNKLDLVNGDIGKWVKTKYPIPHWNDLLWFVGLVNDKNIYAAFGSDIYTSKFQ